MQGEEVDAIDRESAGRGSDDGAQVEVSREVHKVWAASFNQSSDVAA